MTDATISVHPDVYIDRIAPELHGHFSEHLGRCIYDGIWHDDTVTDDGFREEVVALLDDLDIPVLRWPGGCFADDYHWEDGIGPREERPRRRNLFWSQGAEAIPEESNAFGTDEFLRLCDRINAEPYIATNVGSGNPQEATDWVEYCNYDGDTELADRRRENGHEEPYEVRYWGIGNENWGCGGQMEPEQYAREYRRFATYVGSTDKLMLDTDLELIACGFEGHNWNRRFMDEIGSTNWGVTFPLDHLTLHHYYGRAMTISAADEEQYDEFLAEALKMSNHIERIAAAINSVATTRDIGVIVDEWGAWHTDAIAENGLEQPGTVLDALSAAVVLDIFNHHSDVMTMANIAQTVNVLHCLIETDDDNAWKRPTYHVFDLYAPHKGNMAIQTLVETVTRDLEDGELPLIGASASTTDSEIYLTVTNHDCREARTIEITIEGAVVDTTNLDARILFAGHDANAAVTAANAEEFEAQALDTETNSDGNLVVELAPSTVAAISI